MNYLILCWEFFKIGLFSIGGGLSSLPFLYQLATRYDWLQTQDITKIVAIAESTPGAIGVNAATYAGYHAGGVLGGVIATLAYITPAVMIITVAAKLLERYYKTTLVQSVFGGIRPAVTALIGAAGLNVCNNVLFSFGGWSPEALLGGLHWKALLIFAITIFTFLKFNKHPILYIACAAVVGILLKM